MDSFEEETVMEGEHPQSTASILGHPIHPMLVPLPITFFLATLATDLMFLADGSEGWAVASRWLLGAGLVGAALAAAAGLTDFAGDRRIRQLSDAWTHMVGNVVVVLIEAVNLFLRLGDDGVSGSGIILSAVAAVILAFTGWKGGELVFRHGVGVHSRGRSTI